MQVLPIAALMVLVSAIGPPFPDDPPGLGGGQGGDCAVPSVGPDIVVGNITQILKWGTIDNVTGYSIATDSCNIGDTVLPFQPLNNQHPLITQNLYRLANGRIQMIGMSWVKHAFGAAALNTCCVCNNPGDGQLLGIGCSDPYSANTNGNQAGFGIPPRGGLGPRSDVNAFTGDFPFPYNTQGQSGDVLFKRTQVHNDDLDPSLNAGALYFSESQYISSADASAGNQNNNVSYRPVSVGVFDGEGFALAQMDQTRRQKAAIEAWQEVDPAVGLSIIDVPDEGRLVHAFKASLNPDSTWHYEYALYNMTSHRSAQSWSVPIPTQVVPFAVGFSDIDYHSGEIFDSTDWTSTVQGGFVTWSTDAFDANPNANALRWGTLYNFWFDANAPPQDVSATVALFRPGTPDSVQVQTVAPSTNGGKTPAPPLPEDGLQQVCGVDGKCPGQSECVAGICYVPKSRYLSLWPNPVNAGMSTARRISVVTGAAPASLGWVGQPQLQIGLGNVFTAPISDTPLFLDWSAFPAVHVGDCQIIGARNYLIQTTSNGAAFSPSLQLVTVEQWGDVIGQTLEGGAAPPQGVANLVDAQQIVKGFQTTNTAPMVWLDLEPEAINGIVNLVDAQQSVKGFQGDAYPFSDPCTCSGLAPCP